MNRSGRAHVTLAGVACLLAACAPPLRDPWGLSVTRGEAPAPAPAPERLQADLTVQPQGAGAVPVSARFYAEPSESSRRYRVDVFGLAGQTAATWLWSERSWLLVRHDTRTVQTGVGDALEANGLPVRIPNARAALGFLWGQPLPGFPGGGFSVGPAGDTVRWSHAGEEWEALLDPVTGLCREARSPSMSLHYARHRRHGPWIVPEEVEVRENGRTLVTLRLGDWNGSPEWKKDPFMLRIPEGYSRE